MSGLSTLKALRATVAPRPVYTPADDARLAAALFKVFPTPDQFRHQGKPLDDELLKELPGETPVMMFGRALELGYLLAHNWHGLSPGYVRPFFSFLPTRYLAAGPLDPRVKNGQHIAAASARVPKILAKLAAAERTPPDPLRVAVPEGSGDAAEQVVVFTADSAGRYQYQCLER